MLRTEVTCRSFKKKKKQEAIISSRFLFVLIKADICRFLNQSMKSNNQS